MLVTISGSTDNPSRSTSDPDRDIIDMMSPDNAVYVQLISSHV